MAIKKKAILSLKPEVTEVIPTLDDMSGMSDIILALALKYNYDVIKTANPTKNSELVMKAVQNTVQISKLLELRKGKKDDWSITDDMLDGEEENAR